MATIPRRRRPAPAPYALAPFDAVLADLVARWAPTADDCWRVAPRTAPPLTPAKVRAWGREGEAMILRRTADDAPLGYAELNRLNRIQKTYWIGHVLVDPAERGQGIGTVLIRLLLRRAFNAKGASRVSLVVFPDNPAAIACYKAAGMSADGWETHSFPAYGRREQLIRFVASPPRR